MAACARCVRRDQHHPALPCPRIQKRGCRTQQHARTLGPLNSYRIPHPHPHPHAGGKIARSPHPACACGWPHATTAKAVLPVECRHATACVMRAGQRSISEAEPEREQQTCRWVTIAGLGPGPGGASPGAPAWPWQVLDWQTQKLWG